MIGLLLFIGCNRDTGPARYDLKGSITYAGKPVPAGYILFAPDKSKGNDGPGACGFLILSAQPVIMGGHDFVPRR